MDKCYKYPYLIRGSYICKQVGTVVQVCKFRVCMVYSEAQQHALRIDTKEPVLIHFAELLMNILGVDYISLIVL